MASDVKDNGSGPKRTQKSIDAVSQFPSFFSNDHHAYAARKAERLSSAVHVVTSFIPREEPIRAMLRSVSLEVLRLATDPARLAEGGPNSMAVRCAEISSMLETAESSGLISTMNAKLIVAEYAALSVFVKERYGLLRPRVADISDTAPPLMSFRNPKDINSYRTNYKTPAVSDRKGDILGLLSVKDKISIKDAVQSIPGVSEKTIQRELMSLVSEGLLIREGERRWSTYRRPEKSDLHESTGLGSISQ